MVAPAAAAAVRAGAARASSSRATTAAALAGVQRPAATRPVGTSRPVTTGTGSAPATPRRSRSAHGLGGGAIVGGPRYQRMLKAEWLLCMVILALSPLADPDSEEGIGDALKRCAACTGVFFILGLVATGGPKPAKAAAGFGGLVTVALVLTSRDVFGAVASRLQAGFKGTQAQPAAGDTGAGVGGTASGAAGAIADQLGGGGGPDGGSQPFTGNGAPIQLPPGMQP